MSIIAILKELDLKTTKTRPRRAESAMVSGFSPGRAMTKNGRFMLYSEKGFARKIRSRVESILRERDCTYDISFINKRARLALKVA